MACALGVGTSALLVVAGFEVDEGIIDSWRSWTRDEGVFVCEDWVCDHWCWGWSACHGARSLERNIPASEATRPIRIVVAFMLKRSICWLLGQSSVVVDSDKLTDWS